MVDLFRVTLAANSGNGSSGHSDEGFTLIEVLVTMLVLAVGIFATLNLLDTSNQATASTLKQDGANSLAREIVERTNGMKYESLTTAGAPATLRQAADPTGSQNSVSTGPNSWTIRRRNTVYTVTYSACTKTDAVNGITIIDPTDCDYADTPDPPVGGQDPTGQCKVGIVDQSDFTPGQVSVTLKALGVLSLDLCLQGRLVGAVCNLLGNSSNLRGVLDSLTGRQGILNILGGSLGVGVGVGLCGGSAALDPTAGLTVPDVRGSSTRTTVRVVWNDKGKSRTITQTGLVQRTPPGTGA